MAIVEEIFDTNHVRRYSDNNVKIKNENTGEVYDKAEDWTNEWLIAHGYKALSYIETEQNTID